jgi:hypothetical protein
MCGWQWGDNIVEKLEPGDQVITDTGISRPSVYIRPGSRGVVYECTSVGFGKWEYEILFDTPALEPTKVAGIRPDEIRRHKPATPFRPDEAPPQTPINYRPLKGVGGRSVGGGIGADLGPVGTIMLIGFGLALIGGVLYGLFVGLPFLIGQATWGRLHPWETDTESPLALVRTLAGLCVMAVLVALYLLLPFPWRRDRSTSRNLLRRLFAVALICSSVLAWFAVLPTMEQRAAAEDKKATRSLLYEAYWSTLDDSGVSYSGADVQKNMQRALDKSSATAWRVRGDARGRKLSIRFGTRFNLRLVGLVPGYAKDGRKTSGAFFRQQRRIAEVRWHFVHNDSSATIIVQRFKDAPRMQSIRVNEKDVRELIIEIRKTRPGHTDNSTAVSSIAIIGREYHDMW